MKKIIRVKGEYTDEYDKFDQIYINDNLLLSTCECTECSHDAIYKKVLIILFPF